MQSHHWYTSWEGDYQSSNSATGTQKTSAQNPWTKTTLENGIYWLNNPRTNQSAELLKVKQREKSNSAKELFLDTSFLEKGAKEDLPWSYEETIKGPEADQWKEAMDVKMSQLKGMGTWKIYLKNEKQ